MINGNGDMVGFDRNGIITENQANGPISISSNGDIKQDIFNGYEPNASLDGTGADYFDSMTE